MRRALPILRVAASLVLLAISARAQGPASMVVAGGTVVTMDASRRIIENGAVAIRDDRIVDVGPLDEVRARHVAARMVDATNRVVLPGLINTHTHAPMVLYRGLADDLQLDEWLEQYIFPAEAKTVSPAFVRVGTRLAALEMIRSGTTTFVDMYYFEEEIAAVAEEVGLRGVLGQTIIQFPAPDAPTAEEGLRRAERFVTQWKGNALVTPAIAPHAMYTLPETGLRAAKSLAARHGVPLLIHLAEAESEMDGARQRHQSTPTGFLDRLGFWGPGSLAAHAVWLTGEDIATLARRGVGVAHNPESNMKLASGIAPVPALRTAGVAVGLGTDGAASNNDLDMFEAMRQAALLHKVATRDPRAVGAIDALEMATIDGARALGMQSAVGSLEAGKRADLIVVAMDGPRQTPMYDPVSHLVYVGRGDDVVTTIVNGRVLMEERRFLTLDAAEVLREARAAAVKVREAVAPE